MSRNLSAVELLELGDEDRKKPWLNQYWPQALGVAFGLATGVAVNFGTRRPLMSGIQKHVLAVGGWTVVLSYAQKKREEYFAEQDAVMRHYISLHPEDFPTPERKKIGDIIEPWFPIR